MIDIALDNPQKISFLSFQPVSFTGRDEEITPEDEGQNAEMARLNRQHVLREDWNLVPIELLRSTAWRSESDAFPAGR